MPTPGVLTGAAGGGGSHDFQVTVRTSRTSHLVASRSRGSAAGRVGGSRTVRSDRGGAAASGSGSTAGRNRSRSTSDGRGSATDGRGSGAGGGSSGAAAHGGGSGAGRRGGSTAGHAGGSGAAGGGSASRSAAVAAATMAQAQSESAATVAAVTVAPLLAAANLLATHFLAAARGWCTATRGRSTAARGRGGSAAVGRQRFRNAGTDEQHCDGKSCPLHVWYYSWKGTSGTETVANPRNRVQRQRHRSDAGRKAGDYHCHTRFTPTISSCPGNCHHAKALPFFDHRPRRTVVSSVRFFGGTGNS